MASRNDFSSSLCHTRGIRRRYSDLPLQYDTPSSHFFNARFLYIKFGLEIRKSLHTRMVHTIRKTLHAKTLLTTNSNSTCSAPHYLVKHLHPQGMGDVSSGWPMFVHAVPLAYFGI
jgi:hypothetical protein